MEPHIPSHVEAVYKDAADNIRFFRSQQFVIYNFVIAIDGVIFFLARNVEGWARALLMALAAVTFLYGVYLLINARYAISDARRRFEWIHQRYFTEEERQGLELLKPGPLLREPLVGMIFILTVAFAIGTAVVLKLI